MTGASANELARCAAEQLPEDATLEDASERFCLLEKVEQR